MRAKVTEVSPKYGTVLPGRAIRSWVLALIVLTPLHALAAAGDWPSGEVRQGMAWPPPPGTSCW